MHIRFYRDPATGEPHIYNHGVTENEPFICRDNAPGTASNEGVEELDVVEAEGVAHQVAISLSGPAPNELRIRMASHRHTIVG